MYIYLNYFSSFLYCSPEEQEDGFSFLVLLKATPPYGTIRPLTKVLQVGRYFYVIDITWLQFSTSPQIAMPQLGVNFFASIQCQYNKTLE